MSRTSYFVSKIVFKQNQIFKWDFLFLFFFIVFDGHVYLATATVTFALFKHFSFWDLLLAISPKLDYTGFSFSVCEGLFNEFTPANIALHKTTR